MYLNYRKTLFDQTQDGRPESQNQIYSLKWKHLTQQLQRGKHSQGVIWEKNKTKGIFVQKTRAKF